jgi:hypothetical protein
MKNLFFGLVLLILLIGQSSYGQIIIEDDYYGSSKVFNFFENLDDEGDTIHFYESIDYRASLILGIENSSFKSNSATYNLTKVALNCEHSGMNFSIISETGVNSIMLDSGYNLISIETRIIDEESDTIQILLSDSEHNLIHSIKFILAAEDVNDAIILNSEFYEEIKDWLQSESEIGFFDYFDGKHPVDKIGFIQTFFGISRQEIDDTLIFSEGQLMVNPLFYTTLQQVILDSYNTTTSDTSCNCRIVGTNVDAVHVPIREVAINGSCKNYIPTNSVIVNHDLHDTKLVNWRTFILGAGKMTNLRMAYVNGKQSGKREFKTLAGPSDIRYLLTCLNPSNISPNNNCQCPKEVDIEYEYRSRYFANATRQWHPLGTQAYVSMEDIAFLIAINGDNELEIVESGAGKIKVECNRDENENESNNFFTSLGDIAKEIKDVVESVSQKDWGEAISQIFNTVGSIAEFVDREFMFARVCQEVHREEKLLGGKRKYQVTPNKELRFILFSSINYEAETKRRAQIVGRANSDFYLAAVLTSLHGESDNCCQEKIGSYVLSTVAGFPYDASELSNNGPSDGNYVGLNNHAPLGLASLQSLVGSFIGLRGPWDGKFEQDCGGCSGVKINCYAECQILRDCPPLSEDVSTHQRPFTLPDNSLSDFIKDHDIMVFPNPFNSELNIRITSKIAEQEPMSIQLLNQMGQIVKNVQVSQPAGNSTLFTDDLPNGLYLLEIKNNSGLIYMQKIIK